MSFKDDFNLPDFYARMIPTNSDDDMNSGKNNILNIEQCQNRMNELTKRIRQKEMEKECCQNVLL